MKRTAIFLLAMLMLASCAPKIDTETGDKTTNVEDTKDNTPDDTPAETEDPGVRALLPEANYGDASFHIMNEYKSNYSDLEQPEEESAESLSSAVYKRNLAVEDLYGVDLIYVKPTAEPREEYPRLSMAGDDTFKLYYSRARYISEYIGQNVSRAWSDYPQIIDFEAPWFNTYAIETFSIGDKVHILVGDQNDSTMRAAWVWLFNKELAETYGVPNLYSVVDEGKWTIDYLRTITENVYTDNGDGVKDDKDIYGFVTDNEAACDQWVRTIGMGAVGKDENNMPVFLPLQEQTINGFEKIMSLMWESNGTYIYRGADVGSTKGSFYQCEQDGMFVTDQALISHIMVNYLERSWMREMTDFGVLPTPKLTEDQDMGYTHTDCMFTTLLLPSVLNEEDAEMSAIITNALNAFSYEIVKPEYYETVLKIRLTRDSDASRMMDLVMEGRRYSLDMIGESDFPLTHINMLRARLGKQRGGLTTVYKANEKRCNEWIANYVESISNLGN